MKEIAGNVIILLLICVAVVFLSIAGTLLVLESNDVIEIVNGDVQSIEYEHECEISWDTTVSGGAAAIINPGEPDEEVLLWRDCQLWELNDESSEVLSLQCFDTDVATLIHEMIVDEEMQGHLLRHGVSQDEIDFIEKKFRDDCLIRH